jgi:hypothetical protein
MSKPTRCGPRFRHIAWQYLGAGSYRLQRWAPGANGASRRLAAAALGLTLALVPQVATAQTGFIPYYGKNQIRYDNFQWQIYETDHFEIFYYPEIEPHLERVAGYAESAYQHVSSELRHDLAQRIPLILFLTSSEFQQQNVIPGGAQEGVLAFAEPLRGRIVMPLDEPPDMLYRLIVHELTHQFEFDIMPVSLVRRSVPLWVMEGLADYMTGYWRPTDLMSVRDAAVADIIPRMSKLEGYTQTGDVRLVYNLGHAAFEFIEQRWSKEGLRQFLFSLRKSIIGGGDNAYQEAFRISPEEFDQEFDKYLKDRFRPFRDKERPADYGRNIAPDSERTRFTQALTIEPSPSGDLLAMVTVNRRDRDYDIVLVSTKDGTVVRNLTQGFPKDYGFEYITFPTGFNTVPWLSWSPSGDRLAYFVRSEKSRSLILQNVLTRRIEQRIDLRSVDNPESPQFSPDGRHVVFAALSGGVGNIFMVDLETQAVTNLTNDDFANSGPTWSPDGSYILYLARISGSEKLFRLDLESGRKTQLTFGTHDDTAARFLDAETIVFSSTATDPAQPIDPDVARNANIYNVWTLNLKTGELRQYTDALGGNLSPVALNRGTDRPQIAFISYYKGERSVHALDRRDPIVTAASDDFGSPGPVIDFQAPLSHTLIADNKRRKGTFEKMYLDGRPPVNVGVTSSGDIFGGSAVTFSDVLGDKQVNFYAASISQYRTLSFSYINLSRRLNYAFQGFSQTQFFYGQLEGLFYDPAFAGLLSRDLAVATRTIRGGSAFGIYPVDRYRRFEVFGGAMQYREQFNDPSLEDYSRGYQEAEFGRALFRSGTSIPLGVSFVQETTVFREFGPLAGNTMRLSYEVAPKIGNTLSRQTVDTDARYYKRLGASGLLALRARGFKSWGASPDFTYFGGNSEMRGYQYLEFIGDNAVFLNAELRFPLIEAMLTPIGILGGIRGVFFANMGGSSFGGITNDPGRNRQGFKWASRSSEVYTPVVGYDPFTGAPQLGDPVRIDGLRLVDSRASYGFGLETFALGFPIHFDWAWRTMFNRTWEDARFAAFGGSAAFRKPKFSIWIGYDF